ncbi:MAG: type II toxin-antitoxin system death-on-curing family toxin [Cyanobacteria bacterium SZAS TMP-1]|nr:type II toxin-antitoxin system death-on-curing family toxin [Cyanobacteria bacterium SZAS TMP-1]
MDEIRFLSVSEIIAIHDSQLRNHGGGLPGLRDIGLLESAAAAPFATFGGAFLNPTLSAMAASYLVGIARNHAFLDGNKRTALAAVSVFLLINGFALDSRREDELVEFVVGVASGLVSKEEATTFLEALIIDSEASGAF